MADPNFIEKLEVIVHDRLAQPSEGSYTAKIARQGILAAAQKVGEEGVELALAAAAGDAADVVAESADLIFHTLVVLAMRGITLERVIEELEQRHQTRTAE
jgi:phosphoribosyl-ATP pyrophosphohydrolase